MTLKRLTALLITASMIALALGPAAVFATEPFVVGPVLTQTRYEPGDTFSVPIVVDEVVGLEGVTFELEFDPQLLQVIDFDNATAGVQVEPGDVFPPGALIEPNKADNSTGSILYSVLSFAGPVSGTKTIAIVHFQTSTTVEGQTTIRFNPLSGAAPGGILLAGRDEVANVVSLPCAPREVVVTVAAPDLTPPTITPVTPFEPADPETPVTVGPTGVTISADIFDAGEVDGTSIALYWKRPGDAAYSAVAASDFTQTQHSATAWSIAFSPTAALTDGTYWVKVAAGDVSGNSSSREWAFIVSSEVPGVTVTLNPATPDGNAGWYRTEPRVVLTSTALVKYAVVPHGDAAPSRETAEAWTTYEPGTPEDTGFALGDGSWSVFYYATNTFTQVEGATAGPINLKVDTLPPAVTSVALAPSTALLGLGDGLTITVLAANAETGLTGSVVFNGQTLVLTEVAAAPGAYQATYTAAPGHPTVSGAEATSVVLVDEAGNQSSATASSGNSVDIDTVAPEFHATDGLTVTPPSPTNQATATATVKVKDVAPTAVAPMVWVVVDPTPDYEPSTADEAQLAGGPDASGYYTYTKQVSFSQVEPGVTTHTVVAVAADLAENVAVAQAEMVYDTVTHVTLTGPTALVSAGPESPFYFNNSPFVLTGEVEVGATAAVFYVDGTERTLLADLDVSAAGDFSYSLSLPPALADGLYGVVVVSTDLAGNTAESGRPVVLDTTAPVVTITTPVEGALTNQTAVALTGSITELNPLRVRYGTRRGPSVYAQVVWGDWVAFPAAGTFTSPELGIVEEEGVWTELWVEVEDRAGNTTTAQRTVTYTTQAIPLNVYLGDGTTPLTTPYYTNQAAVELVVDTGEVDDATLTVQVGEATPLPLTRDPDGKFRYTVALTAPVNVILEAAKEGRSPNSRLFRFEYDVTPPVFDSATVSVTPDIAKAGPVVIAIECEPLQAPPVVKVVPFGMTEAQATTVTMDGGGGSYTGTFTVTAELPNGAAQVLVTGTDRAGNTGSGGTGFTIDTVAPTFTVTATPDPARAGAVTIRVDASEPLSAPPTVHVLPADMPAPGDAVAMTPVNGYYEGVYQVTADTANGTAAIAVTGADLAGNQGVGSGSFTIDTAAPVLELELSVEFAPVGDVTITVTADEELLVPPVVSVRPAGSAPETVTMALLSGPGESGEYVYTGTYAVTATTAEGPALVNVAGADPAGNESTTSGMFTVDRTCELTLVYHDAPTPLGAGATFQVIAVGEPAARSVTVDLLTAGEPTPFTEGIGGTYYSPVFEVGEDENFSRTLAVTMVDRAGNVKTENTTVLTVDTTPPGISNVQVSPRVAKLGDVVTVSFTSSEPLARATFSVGSIRSGVLMSSGDGSTYTGTFTVTAASADGVHAISVRARDRAGNITTDDTSAGAITVDKTPPVPSFTVAGTAGEHGYYTSAVEVTLAANEPNCTLASELRHDGVLVDSATAPAPVVFNLTADGVWTLSYTLTDAAGNTTAGSKQYKVDMTAPAAPTLVIAKSDGTPLPVTAGVVYTNLQTVKAIVTGGEDDLRALLSVDGVSRGRRWVDEVDGAEFVVALRATGDATTSINAKAVDLAGNQSAGTAVSVVLDAVPPTFAIALDETTLVVTATANEVIDGIAHITIKVGTGAESELVADRIPMTAVDATTFTYALAFTPDQAALAAQELSLNVRGYDLAGNRGVSALTAAVIPPDTQVTVGGETVEMTFVGQTFDAATQLQFSSVVTPSGDGTTVVAYDFNASQNSQPVQPEEPVAVVFWVPVPSGVDPVTFQAGARLMLIDGTGQHVEPVVGVDIAAPGATYRLEQAQDGSWLLVIEAALLHFSEWPVVVDVTPPALAVTAPAEGAVISTTRGLTAGAVRVEGTALDDVPGRPVTVTVSINGQAAGSVITTSGDFALDLQLSDPAWLDSAGNVITVAAADPAGNTVSSTVNVYYDVTAPVLSNLSAPTLTNATSVTLTGQVAAADAGATIDVTVGASSLTATAAPDGSFTLVVPLAQEGNNTVAVTATDTYGNTSDASSLVITRDTLAPVITVNAPGVTATSPVRITGSVNEPVSSLTCAVNGGAAAELGTATSFATDVPLSVGDNTVVFTATDNAGNASTTTVAVKYDPNAPSITVTSTVPEVTSANTVTFTGTTKTGANLTVRRDGAVLTVLTVTAADGAFTVDVPLGDTDGAKVINLRAFDPGNGLAADATYTVTRDATPPVLTLAPTPPATTTTAALTITGSANETITALTLNNVAKTIAGDGRSFSIAVTLNAGANQLTLVATDRAGNQGTLTLSVTYTPPAPPAGDYVGVPTVITGPQAAAKVGAAGGTVRTQDGSLEVTVPAGAAAADVEATIAMLFTVDKPAPQFRLTKAVRVEFKSSATGEPVTTFERPYQLSIRVHPLEIVGISPSLLRVYYWHEELKFWVALDSAFDADSYTFTVSLPHATVFAVMADISGSAAPTIGSAPERKLSGKLWLAQGTAPAGSTVKVAVNDGIQTTVTADAAGKWQAWVTLAEGVNRVFAVSGDATARTSVETHPVYLPLVLTDLAAHWAQTYVTELVDHNVITGYEDASFRPENDITRAEFCALIVRSFGLEPAADAVAAFADADAIADWAKPLVGAAYRAGIVLGYEDGSFRAGDNITRAEMAVMVARSLALKGALAAPTVPAPVFGDEGAIPAWALEHVRTAAQRGIISGYPDGSFGPANLATRAEAATMVIRVLKLK